MSSPTIAMKDASVARGGLDHVSGSNFIPGRTICYYVAGQFSCAVPSGPYGTQAYGAANKQLPIPSGIPAAAGTPVAAIDNTDPTDKATTTVTTT